MKRVLGLLAIVALLTGCTSAQRADIGFIDNLTLWGENVHGDGEIDNSFNRNEHNSRVSGWRVGMSIGWTFGAAQRVPVYYRPMNVPERSEAGIQP